MIVKKSNRSGCKVGTRILGSVLAAATLAMAGPAAWAQTTTANYAENVGSAYRIQSNGVVSASYLDMEDVGSYTEYSVLDFTSATLFSGQGATTVDSVNGLTLNLWDAGYSWEVGGTFNIYLANADATNYTLTPNSSTPVWDSTATTNPLGVGNTTFGGSSNLLSLGSYTFTAGGGVGTEDILGTGVSGNGQLTLSSAADSIIQSQINSGGNVRLVVTLDQASTSAAIAYEGTSTYNSGGKTSYPANLSLNLTTSPGMPSTDTIAITGTAPAVNVNAKTVNIGTSGAPVRWCEGGTVPITVTDSGTGGTAFVASPDAVTYASGGGALTANGTGTLNVGVADPTTDANNNPSYTYGTVRSGTVTVKNINNPSDSNASVNINAIVVHPRYIDSTYATEQVDGGNGILVGKTVTTSIAITTYNPASLAAYFPSGISTANSTTVTLLGSTSYSGTLGSPSNPVANITIATDSKGADTTFNDTVTGEYGTVTATRTVTCQPLVSGVALSGGGLGAHYQTLPLRYDDTALGGTDPNDPTNAYSTAEVYVTFTAYQPASVSGNTSAPLTNGATMTLTQAGTTDPIATGQRMPAAVVAAQFTGDSNMSFSQTGFDTGGAGIGTLLGTYKADATDDTSGSASATAHVTMNSTNRMNGTYSGTATVSLESDDQAVIGTAHNDVTPVAWTVSATVSGQQNGSGVHTGTYGLTGGSYVGGNIVLSGTYTQTRGNATLTSLAGTGTRQNSTGVTTINGGTFSANSIRQSSLSIATGAKVTLAPSGGTNPNASVLSSLSITGTGDLDLNDNGLIITGASQTTENTVKSLIAGHEIISSVVSAHSGMTIAYDFAQDISSTPFTWGGETVSGTDLLILPTLNGDLNMDGAVNFTDVTALAPNLGKASGQTWATGDLNGDGAVNFTDVTALAPNLGKSVASLAAPNFVIGPAQATATPEPASLLLLGLGGLLALPRRRRAV